MKQIIKEYNEAEVSNAATLRTIVLFGRNVSTYKFALSSALLNLKPKNFITYEELRDDFLSSLYQHYLKNPHQYQGGENSLTKGFDQYKLDKNWESLIQVAEKNIYNNVFDAFHNVGGGSIKKEFSFFEHNPKERKLILTDRLNELLEDHQITKILSGENESRWTLVEEAWKNKLSPNLLEFDNKSKEFISVSKNDRVNLRSAVTILLPYQHGKCFYCNKEINLDAKPEEHDFADVDHFLAHSFFKWSELSLISPDGIWNLVVACKECNRGSEGKFDRLPNNAFQKDLMNRNVLFTEEHRHSLKNSILISLKATNHKMVERKMINIFKLFNMLEGWSPKMIYN